MIDESMQGRQFYQPWGKEVIDFPGAHERQVRAQLKKELNGPDNGFIFAAMSRPSSKQQLIEKRMAEQPLKKQKGSFLKGTSKLRQFSDYLGLTNADWRPEE